MMNYSFKSPLKAKPLRSPGQSVNASIQRLMENEVLPLVLAPAMLWGFALAEWIAKLSAAPRIPGWYAIAAVAATGAAAYRITGLKRRIRRLTLARDGELAVGQYLEGLREDGAMIFHDIPGEGFNLDHVIICRKGIFVVETKTRSKPYPDAKITVDGTAIKVAGRLIERDPIKQSRAQVSWLAQLLRESTGRSFPVKGSIVFPGWYVESRAIDRNLGIWVLSARALPKFIENEPDRLQPREISLASFHLSRFVRSAKEMIEA